MEAWNVPGKMRGRCSSLNTWLTLPGELEEKLLPEGELSRGSRQDDGDNKQREDNQTAIPALDVEHLGRRKHAVC